MNTLYVPVEIQDDRINEISTVRSARAYFINGEIKNYYYCCGGINEVPAQVSTTTIHDSHYTTKTLDAAAWSLGVAQLIRGQKPSGGYSPEAVAAKLHALKCDNYLHRNDCIHALSKENVIAVEEGGRTGEPVLKIERKEDRKVTAS